MASETFFDIGDRVKFSKGWFRRRKNEVLLMKLRGIVTDVSDTSRECCYYQVKWEATDQELVPIRKDLDEDDWYQSDALVKARKKSQ